MKLMNEGQGHGKDSAGRRLSLTEKEIKELNGQPWRIYFLAPYFTEEEIKELRDRPWQLGYYKQNTDNEEEEER